jgi:2-amino-4-hydroxy-6-hydroxymethyldihydropteridine diphosphokinase
LTEEHIVYLGLGTNLGDRQANLRMAQRHLGTVVTVTGSSSIYQTQPWGFEDQPVFLNQVLAGRTVAAPDALLAAAKDIERRVGRQPSFHYGPRLIDIDILLYDQLQLRSDRLTLPHPHLTERAFVLIPLAELAPDLLIPGTPFTAAEWARRLETPTGVERWNPEADGA